MVGETLLGLCPSVCFGHSISEPLNDLRLHMQMHVKKIFRQQGILLHF